MGLHLEFRIATRVDVLLRPSGERARFLDDRLTDLERYVGGRMARVMRDVRSVVNP